MTPPDAPQVVYTRPFSTMTWLFVPFVLGSIATISTYALGTDSILRHIVWLSFFTIQGASVVLDPRVCAVTTTRTYPDGSKVKIRRPLIGFRCCETQPDPEFQPGWKRHERAYLRI